MPRGCFVWAFVLLAVAPPSDAYDNLFVFGDSLSDIGNTQVRTAGTLFFVNPGPSYHEGRFSNGPVYSELLAEQLGITGFARSTAGGNNFASGGGRTAGTSGFNGLFIEDLNEQVDDYIQNRDPDPEALYIVWAGANDILLGGQTDMSVPVANIASDIERLYNDGGREFLVPNLPKLGATPAHNNAADMDIYNGYTQDFNARIDLALDTLETTLSEITLHRFDIEALFDEVIANPTSFGLANTTEPAAPGLESGDGSYDESNIVANPEQYLFWDTVHPTTTMHAALADAIYAFLTTSTILPGDYNDDGMVNLADYTVWRDQLGSPTSLANDATPGVDIGDYTVWKSNFGSVTADVIPLDATVVPEPDSVLIVALLCLTMVAMRR